LPHLKTVFATAGIALLVAACSSAPAATPADPAVTPKAPTATTAPRATAPTTTPPRTAPALRGPYVALGDSYTAGLGIPEQTGPVAGCGQSTASYPYLVARSLRLTLTDMSCSSATIPDLTTEQATGQGTNPAQLSALAPGTALVTVSIGGNDIGIIDIVTKCAELDLLPALIPSGRSSALTPCENYYTAGGADQIRQRIETMSADLAGALTEIRARAPRARVYVVGYPDLLPTRGGGCSDALGITAGDIAFLDAEEVRLNEALRAAAAGAGDGYVDTYAPSVGHDACAAPAERWLEPLVSSGAAAPLHPNAAGERAMADAVLAAVTSAG